MNKLLDEIKKTLDDYPLLHLVQYGQHVRVEGDIVLSEEEYGEFDRYSVSISFPKDYPNCFPKVVETEKKIPREDYRHVNPDGTLCLAVEPEERMLTKKGIKFKFFIDQVLIPHLSRETFRELNGSYVDGEYDHGYAGIWQFYFKKLGTDDKQVILAELKQMTESQWPNRNAPCLCGSNLKFKRCHQPKWEELKKLGTNYISSQIQQLENNLRNE